MALDFGKILGPLLGIGATAGAGLLTKEAYDQLSTIGETAKAEATTLAGEIPTMAAFKPFTVTTGMGGKLDVDETGSAALSLGGPESQLSSALLSEAGQRFGVGPVGAEQLAGAGQQLLGRGQEQLGVSPFGLEGQQAAAQQAFGLGGQFMSQTGMPMAGREQEVYDRIRATQLGEEERKQLALEERLFAQGRGGVQTAMYGGTPEQLALSKAQEEAQNQASLMAITQAQKEQLQQADIGSTYGQLGSNIATQRQALEAAQQLMAQQSMTGGMGLLAGGMGLQQAQQQLGLGALGGAYVPQAQLLNAIQATSVFPQLQQQAQLFGTGQYGETMMSGIEAQLIAEQARANLLGGIGSGLLGGLFSPVASGGVIGTGIGALFDIGG